jgi:hypothetical protein
MTSSSDAERVRTLRRRIRLVMPVTGVLCLGATIFVSWMPWLTLALFIPCVAGLVLVWWLDRRIIRLGGESFWRDGRFRDVDDP